MEKKILIIILAIFILTPPFIYFSRESGKAVVKFSPKVLGTQSSAQEIISKVRKLMELPDEDPTMATITDRVKLEGKPFFVRAQNGDKVLIFQSIKKAILYRESANKIIDVGSINVEVTPSPTVEPTRVPTQIPTPSLTP